MKQHLVELSWAKHACFFFVLQHVDGSFSVKPLKQKQIVGSYISAVLFDHSANSVEFKNKLGLRHGILAMHQCEWIFLVVNSRF